LLDQARTEETYMRLARPRATAPLLAIAMVAAVATSALAGQWRADATRPEIIVLGSGDSLSVLVRAGASRLLIASGDNIDDFDRAYGGILRPTISRLDILIVTGAGQQLLVPERLSDRGVARTVFALRPIGLGQSTGALARAAPRVIKYPTAITLNEGVTVSIDPYPIAASPDTWSVSIVHGTSRVVIAPALEAIPGGASPPSTVIVAGGLDRETLHASQASAVITRGREARDVLRLTKEVGPTSGATRVWVVHDSEFLRIRLKRGAVEIDHSNARELLPPPNPLKTDPASIS
jgi:hypothetical protein